MKLRVLFFWLFFPAVSFSQDTEMDTHQGLIYSAENMQYLGRMADSITHSFRQCTNASSFLSLPQSLVTCIEFIGAKPYRDDIIRSLQQGCTLEEIVLRFPDVKTRKAGRRILVARSEAGNSQKRGDYSFYIASGKGFETVEGDSSWMNKKPGDWIYSTNWSWVADEGGRGSIYDVRAWQLDGPLASRVLPEEYGSLVHYVDCMVDTSTVLMLNERDRHREVNLSFGLLRNHVWLKTDRIIDTFACPEVYLDSIGKEYIWNNYQKDTILKTALDLSIAEALHLGRSNAVLEDIAERIYAPDTVLLLKRSRIVVGSCSMDNYPRMHARDIAILASKARQWPVFIRAHLNIMNDYFIRATDGSYARPGRKTYLRELELLGVPAQDLLLGTILQARNVSPGHYLGNAIRIGRALSETMQPQVLEERLKRFLKDEQLDAFNRSLFFMLYVNYCYNQNEESMKNKIDELKREAGQYPDFFQSTIRKLSY